MTLTLPRNAFDRACLAALALILAGLTLTAFVHAPTPRLDAVFPYYRLDRRPVWVLTGAHFSPRVRFAATPHGGQLFFKDRMYGAEPTILPVAVFSDTYAEATIPADFGPGTYDVGLFEDALKVGEQQNVPLPR